MRKVFVELFPSKVVTKAMVDQNVDNISKLYVGAELSAFDKLTIEDKQSATEKAQ